ncbi:hypothetical protein D9611_010927 [Ephemerocybe angulata]|uniref:Uncharacterized protein n=1 Tax=Ephemerocybe angulata TaxID=980116 RepID=A0A8H5C4R5_9AGAR|nr:hypothetical protein D9611_010927 [Tulosesus angulatus]
MAFSRRCSRCRHLCVGLACSLTVGHIVRRNSLASTVVSSSSIPHLYHAKPRTVEVLWCLVVQASIRRLYQTSGKLA